MQLNSAPGLPRKASRRCTSAAALLCWQGACHCFAGGLATNNKSASHPQLSSQHVSSCCQQWPSLLQLPSRKPGRNSSITRPHFTVMQGLLRRAYQLSGLQNSQAQCNEFILINMNSFLPVCSLHQPDNTTAMAVVLCKAHGTCSCMVLHIIMVGSSRLVNPQGLQAAKSPAPMALLLVAS
jgi:hypothetical protein